MLILWCSKSDNVGELVRTEQSYSVNYGINVCPPLEISPSKATKVPELVKVNSVGGGAYGHLSPPRTSDSHVNRPDICSPLPKTSQMEQIRVCFVFLALSPLLFFCKYNCYEETGRYEF